MKSTALAVLTVVLSCAPAVAAQGPQPGDVAVQASNDSVRFTIITAGGYVGFAVSGEWPVLAMQSRSPITATAFQIPDPVDLETNDSTNMSIVLATPGVPRADSFLASVGRSVQGGSVKTEVRREWTIYEQDAHQGQTLYTTLDGKAKEGDVVCAVRLAWPHLKDEPADHDAKMRTLFDATLASIAGGTGPYQMHPGEVLRRPDPQ